MYDNYHPVKLLMLELSLFLLVGDFPVRVDESYLEILGKDPNRNWSRLPDEVGGGLAGYPEIFHQLHCLVRAISYCETA
jgi:hypothetical protein